MERDDLYKDFNIMAVTFQLTRSRGARPAMFYVLVKTGFDFNSRAHVERDPANIRLIRMRNYFNSRAHVERD